MIKGVTNAGAIPVLERVLQFAGRRHEILSHNVANVSTPGFRPVDVSADQFHNALREAIDTKRMKGASGSELQLAETDQIEFHHDGTTLHPEPAGENILFHDGNDRNMERLMQGLVENFMAFRMAAQFIRKDFESIKVAIRERL